MQNPSQRPSQNNSSSVQNKSLSLFEVFQLNKYIFSLVFLLLTAKAAIAVPACPVGAEVLQPDGTSITVFLRGDEYVHWNESEDGYLITKNETSNEWVYMAEEAGLPVASRHVVGEADPVAVGASRPNKVKLSAAAARSRTERFESELLPAFTSQTGTMYNLVVLVNFSDLAVAYSRQSYDDLFNQVGYAADGAAGSVKDYYHEISYNSLTVQSTVVEAVTLDNGYAYYGANDVFGNDIRPREMVQEALAKLETRGFDFSALDGDGDGWIDGLTIIHAGGGEEYSDNDEDYIWSHQWGLSSMVTYDGVSMQIYHTEPARRGWDGDLSSQGITRIGVICHENAHFLGLPDLYDYDYDSKGAGDFCLMAGGSWNGDSGTSPAHMSAWCKSDMGWVLPTVISSDGVYPLERVEDNSQIFKLQGGFSSNEYFLVENRQGWGFDSGLPGSQRGILIWHVDELQPNNDDQTHYKVDLEEGSGTQDLELNLNEGDDADYFRAGNATMFTESSTPNNLSYSGQALGITITNVGSTGASMAVTFGAIPSISSITPDTGASGTTVNITNLAGTAFLEGAVVKLMQAGQPDIVATNVTVVNATKITCTFSLAGAAVGDWDVRVTNPDGQWAVLANGFNVIPEGTTVFLTEGFESPFVSGAPAGWSKSFLIGTVDWIRNNGDSRDNGSHGGSYNALFYLWDYIDTETYLITPAINFPVGTQEASLEFWHKQDKWLGDQDTLTVYYKTSAGGSWVQLASYTTNVSNWTQRTILLPNTSDDYYIGFLGNAEYGYGVCIDDVKVTGVVMALPIIPDVTGQSQATAEADIVAATFTVGVVTTAYSDTVAAGDVISQSPVGGTAAASGTAVDLVVSDGPRPRIISGYLLEPDDVTAIEGISIETGDPAIADVTDPNGYYELSVAYGWSGIVEPNAVGYIFDPNETGRTLTDVTSDTVLNLTGYLEAFIISGTILEDDAITPIEGVTVTPENGGGYFTNKYDGGGIGASDPNGYYEVLVDHNWSGEVVPMHNAYAFDPNKLSYSNVISDVGGQNYTGTMLTFSISGYIRNILDVPVEGVLVTAENDGGTDTTEADGYYEVWVFYGWTDNVAASKTDYTFTPPEAPYSNVTADQVGDFLAKLDADINSDGFVDVADLAIFCQNWLTSGDLSAGNLNEEGGIDNVDFAELAEYWRE